jgi:hypothetical protein
MDRGYTGKQFVGLFTPSLADQQVEQLFTSEFGSVRGYHVEVNAAPVGIKASCQALLHYLQTTSSEMEVIDYEYLSGSLSEEVIKEVSVASENVLETFRFLPLYFMDPMILTVPVSRGTTELLLHHYSKPEQTPQSTLPIYTLKARPNAGFYPPYLAAQFKI